LNLRVVIISLALYVVTFDCLISLVTKLAELCATLDHFTESTEESFNLQIISILLRSGCLVNAEAELAELGSTTEDITTVVGEGVTEATADTFYLRVLYCRMSCLVDFISNLGSFFYSTDDLSFVVYNNMTNVLKEVFNLRILRLGSSGLVDAKTKFTELSCSS
jgi:hypothetical protein